MYLFKEPLSETQLSQLDHHTRKRYPETPSADLDPNTILGLPPTGARAFANSILAVYHPQVRGCSAIIDEFHESAAYSCCMTILFLQLLATLIVKYFKHALLPTLISLFSSLLFSSLLFSSIVHSKYTFSASPAVNHCKEEGAAPFLAAAPCLAAAVALLLVVVVACKL